MITLFLLASAISSLTTGQSSPISSHTFLPPFLHVQRAVEDLIDPSQCSCPNTRSILGIVWSCLSTIFLCTWVAIHPNIPPTGELGIITFLRRLKLLFVAILAPELIVLFAMSLWISARQKSKKYESRGWTMAHGHFLIMGGFVLMKGEEDMGTLSYELLEQLEKDGDIEFPTITREQIEDRSKADFLSKGIVVLQTFWFIISCIARHTQGLEVTQLEVVTLAYCSLSASIYFLWWSKPLDVQTPTPVYLKAGSDYVHKAELRRAEVIADDYGTNKDINDALGVDGQRKSRILRYWSPFAKVLLKSRYIVLLYVRFTPEGVPKRWAERDPNEGILTTVFRWGITLFEIILSAALFLIFSPFCILWDIIATHPLPPGQNGVHTFYYSTVHGQPDFGTLILLVICFFLTPTSFGALHCLAWRAHFPTTTETIMWKSSSLLITFLPAFVSLTLGLGSETDDWAIDLGPQKDTGSRLRRYGITIAWFIGKTIALFLIFCAIFSFTAYFFARFMLLILSAISLRNLGSTALLDVTWSDFIPHF